MITIITGTPGAGKTLYTIEKLLLPMVGKTIKHMNEAGEEVELPRTIYTNINGLQIDHELIDGGENQGLRDWHKWAKPGSLIVFDEFQKSWPPRANGSKVPDDIQALDTHRHMGVDFILITQSVMNTDRHIHALAGRHLHVRRVANMKAAVVYEWDHVSRLLMYSKAISKSPWRYSSKVFKLYKSAEVHTKQPRNIPTLVWFILAGVGAFVYLSPTTFSRLYERMNPTAKPAEVVGNAKVDQGGSKPAASAPAAPPAAAPAVAIVQAPDERVDFMPRLSDRPWTAPAYDGLRVVVQVPHIAGGVCMSGQCSCFAGDGSRLEVSSSACADWIKSRPFNPYVLPPPPAPNVAGAVAGTASAYTPSAPDQNGPVRGESVASVPMPSGVQNPRADSRPVSPLPPGSPVHPEQSTDGRLPIAPPSLLSPYRRT